MDRLTNQMCVFARAQPEDKLQIVKSLQRQKKVSAMTGDGVNDAPALNAADIGVAMGIQGTEVAKGASDMILTDDDFCSIVAAVEKGRVIYSGIQKFVAFIMSVHIAEVMQIFFCVCVGLPMMRQPVQILFLILVTDLPPSVALGMEPGQEGILKEWPRPRSQNIVLMWMWISIVINGAILSLVIICVYLWALNFYVGAFFNDDIMGAPEEENMSHKLTQARTCAFVSLVWAENVRSYVSRSFDRPVWVQMFANKKMQIAICMAQVALYCAIFIPGLSDTILELDGTVIGFEGWVAAFFGAFGCLVLCEVFKVFTGYQKKQFDTQTVKELQEEEEKRQLEMKSAPTILGKPEAKAPAPAAPAPVVAVVPELVAEAKVASAQPGNHKEAPAPQGTNTTPDGKKSPACGDAMCFPASTCVRTSL
jgi:magnesium-transporting ATPase (P-type)